MKREKDSDKVEIRLHGMLEHARDESIREKEIIEHTFQRR
jgi:hypothetical protein